MLELLNKIKESYSLLELKEDWDDEGANKVDVLAFNKAMIFIHSLAAVVENLCVPDIDLLRDGSISFDFISNTHQLLIIVKPDSASCYGDDGNHVDVIESTDLAEYTLIDWCKKYMTNGNS